MNSRDRDHEIEVQRAVGAFERGSPVLIHDFDTREGETDLVYPASAVESPDIVRLRRDAGGLICVALTDHVARVFHLPFLHEALDHPSTALGDLGYDDRPSFSLTVNHRETHTGVPDAERAKTIRALGRAARAPDEVDFAAEFRSPGHVFLLRAAPGLLADRRGHTELGLALALEADCSPSVVVCEMLDDETGRELSRTAAMEYARSNDLPFIDGQTIVDQLRR